MGVYLTTNRAGVIGLQTSLTLLKAGHKVTVIAEHLPGDESIAYTSPWAGAIWRSHATAEQEEDCAWDMRSYATWMRIAKQDPEQAQKMGMQVCHALFSALPALTLP